MSCLLIALLSSLTGHTFVRYLIAPPLDMPIYEAASLGSLLLGLFLIARMPKWSSRFKAIGLMLACSISCYLLTTLIMLAPEDHKNDFTISSKASGEQGHTAILYFTHGEPRTYEGSFAAWLHAIHEMDETGVPFVPWPFRPFFFKKVREEYFRVGGSFHNMIHARTMARLQEVYRDSSGKPARFYLCYSDDIPGPVEAAVQAISNGATRLILLNVWLTESDHSEGGRKAVEALGPQKYAVKFSATEPLWNSLLMKQMMVSRANAAAGPGSKLDIGVLLVAHGQPESWDRLFQKQPVQENTFRLETKKLLIAQGYREHNIELAYMEFKKPDIKEAVGHLVQNGVKKILVSPVNISAESIHSEHEIPSLVEQAGVPSTIPVIHLGAWNDDQHLIDALLEELARVI